MPNAPHLACRRRPGRRLSDRFDRCLLVEQQLIQQLGRSLYE